MSVSATFGKKLYLKRPVNNQPTYGFDRVGVDSYGWPGWVQLLYGKFLRLSKQGCALKVSVLGFCHVFSDFSIAFPDT
jgi:hypothetical protein